MNLTEDEKKVIITALNKHVEEVRENENIVGQDIRELAGEHRYEDFVEGIIGKLKK
ncbi:MAG: hypothetical protein R6U32_00695 [Candidatus Woesearchaeota archaeon]